MINLRTLGEQWRRWDVTIRDLPLALLLAGVSLVPAFGSLGTSIGDLPHRPYDLLAYLVILLQSLPLAVRRRWPLVCIALISVGFAIDQFRGYDTVAGTGLPIALLSLGATLDYHRRITPVVLSVGYLGFVLVLHRLGAPDQPQDYATFYLALVFAWVLGTWWRRGRVAEAERRRRIAETTRTAERTRIARELHDVVTHHVTAMVVQAEAARYLTESPQRLDETLNGITDTGRRAISELRDLLALLNPDHSSPDGAHADAHTDTHTDEIEPPISDLRSLVEQTRLAGQPIEFAEDGTGTAFSYGAELAAYRVVQESLTNALKYDHGGRTVVRVHRDNQQISVRISTDGTGTYDSPGGSGKGLAGLRERVEILGGEFSAANQPDGSFLVQARIPDGSAE